MSLVVVPWKAKEVNTRTHSHTFSLTHSYPPPHTHSHPPPLHTHTLPLLQTHTHIDMLLIITATCKPVVSQVLHHPYPGTADTKTPRQHYILVILNIINIIEIKVTTKVSSNNNNKCKNELK